ncbi:MAG: transporter associated domain-containing protein [Gammaproteobacteria bacterium]|nr:transporter associated domain-containing protein [Gammaproteobacteria bacterium]MDP7093478.1 transporter associated domain-containing protein [Gammaproteobacteria bacterium]MDP7271586.1 transporter associated domain-containing protein [Gammaproteobacteria bacterium]HJP03861.1 transporter associated domain-containing protein [Gammaproteobacteria bacterium]
MNDEDPNLDESLILRVKRMIKSEPDSRNDLIEMLDGKRWKSVLEKQELRMLKGVLQVSQMQVREVMVPRSHMVVLEREAPMDELLQTIVKCGHSRFPVIGEDRDEVAGILLAKDVLRFFVESPGKTLDVTGFLRPATFIPESKRLDTLLQEFRSGRNHMAIVVDEYGGTSGLLTIEDVLEEIVGEIDDEHDPQEAELIQEQGSHWNVMALTRIDEFNEYFSCNLDDDDYETIGGLIMREFGRLPRRGESIRRDGFEFTVVQADRRRIHRLEVIRTEVAETPE